MIHKPKFENNGDKLQKLLAMAGLGSRRKMEEWIAAGRISVDGKISKIGDRAKLSDRILVDGKPLDRKGTVMTRPRVIAYNKPEGQICSRKDEKGRKTVFDALPRLQKGRWIMVGRLDVNTSGLLLFTTDGELANRLMHPSYEVEREYAVRVFGEVSDDVLANLRTGVQLEDGPAKFNKIEFKGGEGINTWYHVILREGRNREVRRLWESQGLKVSRLTRVRYSYLHLPRTLSAGKAYEYSPDDVNALRKSIGMKRYFFPKDLLEKKRRKI
jgi:23S rRNA pseudouridine2605 synthase